MGGAVLTETVFAWPGLGRLMVKAIFARDYVLLQGAVLVFALAFVVINLAVDLSYGAARSARVARRASAMRRSSRRRPRWTGRRGWWPSPTIVERRLQRPVRGCRFRRNRLAVAGLAHRGPAPDARPLGAPWLAPADPAKQSLIEKRARPGGKFLLGADEFGRDILSRVIYGSRVALLVGLLSVAIALGLAGSPSAAWPASPAAGSTR